MSDALARMSTGGGYSTRKYYTDNEERTFNFARPVILNGIEDIATRPDLLERTLAVELAEITPQKRQPEAELWKRLYEARPRLLGALLDAIAGILRSLPNVAEQNWPRLADFAKWVTAAEQTLGWKEGTFVRVMERSRISANQRAAEEHEPLISALKEFLRTQDRHPGRAVTDTALWSGTATELLSAINPNGYIEGIPRKPNALSGLLKRLKPVLADQGLKVQLGARQGATGTRIIVLTKVAIPEVEEDEEQNLDSAA